MVDSRCLIFDLTDICLVIFVGRKFLCVVFAFNLIFICGDGRDVTLKKDDYVHVFERA
jgi:hypothetical protein